VTVLPVWTIFDNGGNIPEMVFQKSSWCGGCVFSMDCNCLSVAWVQLILLVGHTKDESGRPLLVCCRHRGNRLNSISHKENSRNSSKYHVQHIWNRSETVPQAMSYHVRKRLDQFHPARSCDVWDPPTCFLSWLWLLEASQAHSDSLIGYTLVAANQQWCSNVADAFYR